MIAMSFNDSNNDKARRDGWQAGFLAMLPTIRRVASIRLNRLRGEAREDAIQEVIACCAVAYARLYRQGRVELAYPSVLARFAVRQYHDGRRFGGTLCIRDVLSPYAQRRKGFHVERLDWFNDEENGWKEAVVFDDETPVVDQVAFRLDFPAWLATQGKRRRKIAETLALGHTTGEVAKRFAVSPGRISGLRREFCRSWRDYQGEPSPA